MSIETRAIEFRDRVRPLIQDEDGVHHEFYDGDHGQKLDCAVIEDDPELFDGWVDLTVEGVMHHYGKNLPRFIIGVANGTNLLGECVTQKLNELDESDNPYDQITFLKTRKRDKQFFLDQSAIESLRCVSNAYNPDGTINWALVLEDVGTTGSSALAVIDEVENWASSRISSYEVLNLWQRSLELSALIGANIAYKSLIVEPLDTFSPEDCLQLPNGFCKRDWKLIPHGQ